MDSIKERIKNKQGINRRMIMKYPLYELPPWILFGYFRIIKQSPS